MPFKKRYSHKRKFAPRRRKATTSRSSKFAGRMQRSAMTWIRKKYTKTFTIPVLADGEAGGNTISIIGGRNNQNPVLTKTLFDVNQDSQLAGDMRLY